MIGAVRRKWERFRGTGDAAVTVPPMDGALRPNRALEEAALLATLDAPDSIAVGADRVYASASMNVVTLDLASGNVEVVHTFEAPVTALAASPSGALAIGLDNGRVLIRGGAFDGKDVAASGGGRACPTSLLFLSENELVVAHGSASRAPSDWKRDLMERAATGSVVRVDLATGTASVIAKGLGWPFGLVATEGNAIAVSEAWRHRVLRLQPNGGTTTLLSDLPGYPARIAPASGGTYWLTIFAPRNQLIEFIQREPEFLRRMMDEVAPEYWAAPSLAPSTTFLEPLQGGAQKHLGMLKPWAPTRSYGLVVRLDRNFRPVASFHSRADGTRHGVTAAVEHDGKLLVASKGAGCILALDVAATAKTAGEA